MKTLILFATKYGSVEKVAGLIAEKIPDCTLHNIKEKNDVNLNDYGRIIIGGSIYMGKIQKQISRFCQENLTELLQKEIGLFICAMNMENDKEKQSRDSYPKALVKHSKVASNLGGEFQLEKMNFMEKIIVKKIAKITESISKIDDVSIDKFCGFFN